MQWEGYLKHLENCGGALRNAREYWGASSYLPHLKPLPYRTIGFHIVMWIAGGTRRHKTAKPETAAKMVELKSRVGEVQVLAKQQHLPRLCLRLCA